MESANAHRKMLTAAVSTTLLSMGVDAADRDVLESYTEMMQCFLVEVGYLTKNYCELCGRTEPTIADVILGFVDMGFDVSGLEQFSKKLKINPLPSLQPQQIPKQFNMLQAGTKLPLPHNIPQHYPQFPDPHAYIRTPTHKQPVIDYEAIREKYAVQKKDMERALTKFLAKTSQIHNLFDSDEANMYPLIACKPQFPPYLNALLPQDQIFDPEDLEYDPKAQEEQSPPKKRLKQDQKPSEVAPEPEEEVVEVREEPKVEENTSSQSFDIDNPYLAATKLPAKGE
ncbi:transcription initiation factor TFIID subunit 8-like [Onthophagus taurus]|uniref:transcription initiation factor TFIID subunit 8-like n=1 Tax=Onthophagus taurus TaxID=166361 RepID=UPI000C204658|nr:transcription initiation factor TFIID subunit 8-like [Onthophagus taurus]